VNWIYLAQYRDQWRVLCEGGNKLPVSIRGEKSLDKLSDY
jgi:hypothetical protein